MKLYKLTDREGKTFGGCQWGENVTHTASGKGELCSNGWLHAYTHPLLAVLLNPIHADIINPLLWECSAIRKGMKNDFGLKVGVISCTTLHTIPLPQISNTQRIAFGILCAKAVYKDPDWNQWADNWLSNKDRSTESAERVTETFIGAGAWAVRAVWNDEGAAQDAAWAAVRAARGSASAVELDLIAIAEEAMKY